MFLTPALWQSRRNSQSSVSIKQGVCINNTPGAPWEAQRQGTGASAKSMPFSPRPTHSQKAAQVLGKLEGGCPKLALSQKLSGKQCCHSNQLLLKRLQQLSSTPPYPRALSGFSNLPPTPTPKPVSATRMTVSGGWLGAPFSNAVTLIQTAVWKAGLSHPLLVKKNLGTISSPLWNQRCAQEG